MKSSVSSNFKKMSRSKLLSKNFIEKLNTQVFILSAEKLKRKVADFRAMIFAAYIIEHVIHLATAKIRKDNTPGGENEAHSHRTSHSTWEEDQWPPNLGSRTSWKHRKVREHGLMMSQKSHLKELITLCGHICDFYPKYHCELNFIEQYWGAAKFCY